MFLRGPVLGLAIFVTVVTSAAVDDGCRALASTHPDKTFFPDSERYKFENECRRWPLSSCLEHKAVY